MRKTALFAVLLAGLMLAPVVSSHAAPPPRDYETRLLHDFNDDSLVNAASHAFDSIALDIREGRLPNGAPALILRIILNDGCKENAQGECGTLTETVQFDANGETKTIAFSSDDGGATWYGDADQYVGPLGINDGTRFAIEGWVSMASLGIAPGTETSNWFVDAVDPMPQGVIDGQPEPPCVDPVPLCLAAAFDIGTYTIGDNVDQYIAVTAAALNVQVASGETVELDFDIANLVTESQTVELEILGGTGPASIDVAPNFTDTITVNATGGEANGVVVIARTALGGVAVAATAFEAASTVDERGFSGPEVPPGSSWSHTFQTPGIFAYHNHQAAHVSGAVHIDAARGNGTEHFVSWTGEAFEPAELHIQRGDTVTWTNDGPDIMSVMGGVTDDGSDPLAHDHGDHGHGESVEESPGVALPLLALALIGAVVVMRRT